MTEDHPVRAAHWTNTLRTLIGYPCPKPEALLFASSSRLEDERIERLAEVATDTGADVVHLAWADVDDATPIAVSLCIAHFTTATWIEGVRLYAESEDAPVAFLSDHNCWAIGANRRLTPGALPPVADRARGEAIAMQRWRELVATTKPVTSTGARFIKGAAGLADAVPATITF